MDTREDLDQGRLAGAVLAEQRDDLSRAYLDARIAQSVRAAKPLRHAAHDQEWFGGPGSSVHWKGGILPCAREPVCRRYRMSVEPVGEGGIPCRALLAGAHVGLEDGRADRSVFERAVQVGTDQPWRRHAVGGAIVEPRKRRIRRTGRGATHMDFVRGARESAL